MSEKHFANLIALAPETSLTTPKSQLTSITDHELHSVGVFKARIQSPSVTTEDKVYVIPGLTGPPILSEGCLLNLGLMAYDKEGRFAKPKMRININGVEECDKEIVANLMKEFPLVDNSDGKLGCFTNFKATIKLSAEAKPFVAKARAVPLHYKDQVREKLEEMIRQNVLSWCKPDMRIEHCSALVIVSKKEGHGIRITVDFRILNKYLCRARITSKITIEDLLMKLQGLAYFWSIDIADAFHQIKLTKSSRRYCTIAVPWGNLYFKRLPQGLNCSSDIFDNAMSLALQGIPNTTHFRDDVFGGGRTKEEHDESLRQVIQRFNQLGIVIKTRKTKVRQTRLNFLGYILSSEGLRPCPKKVEAIKSAERPTTKEGLISFLCTIAFQERFIHRFSELSGQLHDLARKGENPIEWTEKDAEAFEELRSALAEDALNNSFKTEYETALWVDAGKKHHVTNERGGFSAVLSQRPKFSNENWRPCYFASKRMTDVQSRYGQTELESEAVAWGAKKFNFYLAGIDHITIFSDCRALIPLYNKHEKQNMPPRIERGVISIQHLNYTLVYVKGTSNIADWPSRNPNPHEPQDQSDKREQKLIRSLKLKLPEQQNISWEEIRAETKKDKVLQKLINAIETGEWPKSDDEVKPYMGFHQQLSTVDGVLMKAKKIVVPKVLRKKLLASDKQVIPPEAMREDIALQHHLCGHSGENRTGAQLIQRYYWPKYRKTIKNVIKKCPACLLMKRDYRREPEGHTPLPPYPMHTLSVDFKGPTDSNHYILVIVDLYSKWPECYIVTTTSFKAIKKHFLSFFAQWGHVKEIKSDNGPPFNSAQWEEFAEQEGFYPRRVTPLHPQGNSESEQLMKLVKKALQLCKLYGYAFEEEIHRQLFNFRATPSTTTGKSPAQLVGKRRYYQHHLGDLTRNDKNIKPIDREELKEITQANHEKSDQKDKWNSREHDLKVGDKVLVDLNTNDPKKKPVFPYETELYTVVDVYKSQITARSPSGKQVVRHSTKFKKYTGEVSKDKGGIPKQKPKAHDRKDGDLKQESPVADKRRLRRDGPVEDLPWIMNKMRI